MLRENDTRRRNLSIYYLPYLIACICRPENSSWVLVLSFYCVVSKAQTQVIMVSASALSLNCLNVLSASLLDAIISIPNWTVISN